MDTVEALLPPVESRGPPPVLRLDTAHLAEVLDRLGDPEALAAGLVNVIGLDGVAERLGSRWSLRRELVYEHVERELERELGTDILYQRIGDTHYVVVQNGRTRLQAQVLCLRCLKEILHHFLGDTRQSDLRLHEVTGVSADEIVGRRVNVTASGAPEPMTESGPDARAAPSVRTFLSDARPPTWVARWSPFVAANGRTVRVSCVLEPVVNLATSSRIGFRLARRVVDLGTQRELTAQELRNLSLADIARVDYATISRGLDRLHAEKGHDKLPTLIVPISYATLSNQRTRETLVGLLEQARAEVRHGLVCEICDLEGVPASALLTAISLIRPFSMRVLAFVIEPRPASLNPLKGLGFDGVSNNCPAGLGDAEFVGWAREACHAAHPVAHAFFLYRVESLQRGALAALAGASHVSLLANAKPTDA